MRHILILGGTGWLGHRLASHLLATGNDVTCLARGSSGQVLDGAVLIQADRTSPDAYAQVSDRDWDEVIELSYAPELVEGALAALAPRARHWTLVSSVSVYADSTLPDADESAALVTATDPTDYAQAKVMAETATAVALGDRLLIVRPGLIAGPGDPSDRFGYWVARFAQARNEPVLVPDTTDRHVQVIDVRDLARWIADAGTRRLTVTIDAVGNSHSLADVLSLCATVAGHTGMMVSADDDWLLKQGVNYWAGPGSLPLWLPVEATGFSRRNNARYKDAAGQLRPIEETIDAVLRDERARGLERERRSGLPRTRELELLASK